MIYESTQEEMFGHFLYKLEYNILSRVKSLEGISNK